MKIINSSSDILQLVSRWAEALHEPVTDEQITSAVRIIQSTDHPPYGDDWAAFIENVNMMEIFDQ